MGLGRHLPRLVLDPFDKAEMASAGTAVVGDLPPGHTVGPRESFGGYLIQPAPDRQHRLGNDVVHRVRLDPAANVALYWPIEVGKEHLEATTRVSDGRLMHVYSTPPKSVGFRFDASTACGPATSCLFRAPGPHLVKCSDDS